MFKRFIGAFVAISMIASPVMAKGGFSSGGGFRGGSSFSSSRSSFGPSSYSRPSFSSGSSYRSSYSSSYSRPSVTTSRFNSGSSYTYRPTQTQVVNRPSGGNTYVNHNYGGGFGGGHSFTSSPFFWMWLMDRPHQAPVYVNGGAPMMGQPGMVQGGAPMVVDNGPGFFSMIFWGLVNLIILIAVVFGLFWVGRKVYNFFKK